MSSDFLIIQAHGRGESKTPQNAFSIRGLGARYDSLYRWLNGKKCSARSVANDWPWDTIVFDDPFDEQSFLVYYEGTISFDEETPYQPLPKIEHKQGVIPDEQKVAGQSYLCNCGHYHVHDPRSWSERQEGIEELLAREIAAAIDAEIIAEILNLAK